MSAFIIKPRPTAAHLGAAMSPFNVSPAARLETLPLAAAPHSKTRLRSPFLQTASLVTWVTTPACRQSELRRRSEHLKEVRRIVASASRRVEAAASSSTRVKLLSHLANIGDAKSLGNPPRFDHHQQLSLRSKRRRRHSGLRPAFIG